MQSLAEAQDRQSRMKSELSVLHSQAIQRQVAARDHQKMNYYAEKQHESEQYKKKHEMLQQRNMQVQGLRMAEHASLQDFLRKQKEIPGGLNDQINGVRVGSSSPYIWQALLL